MRRAARKDENHNELQAVLERLLAGHVTDLSALGLGVGDLYISFGGDPGPSFGIFAEVKKDSKASYTAHQIRFMNAHPGCVHRIETVDDAIRLAKFVREQVRILSAA